MLTVDFAHDEVANTVPYPPLFDDIRRNHGFVDVRGNPGLAAEIIEGDASPALRSLLVSLAATRSPLLTLGCDLGEHERPATDESVRCAAGGYVQWLFNPPEFHNLEQYESLAEALARELDPLSGAYTWEISFVMKFVDLKLDDVGLVPSQWIWFDACASSAPSARAWRELLLQSLEQATSAINFVNSRRLLRGVANCRSCTRALNPSSPADKKAPKVRFGETFKVIELGKRLRCGACRGHGTAILHESSR